MIMKSNSKVVTKEDPFSFVNGISYDPGMKQMFRLLLHVKILFSTFRLHCETWACYVRITYNYDIIRTWSVVLSVCTVCAQSKHNSRLPHSFLLQHRCLWIGNGQTHTSDRLTIPESYLVSMETLQFRLIVFTTLPVTSVANEDFVDEVSCDLILYSFNR